MKIQGRGIGNSAVNFVVLTEERGKKNVKMVSNQVILLGWWWVDGGFKGRNWDLYQYLHCMDNVWWLMVRVVGADGGDLHLWTCDGVETFWGLSWFHGLLFHRSLSLSLWPSVKKTAGFGTGILMLSNDSSQACLNPVLFKYNCGFSLFSWIISSRPAELEHYRHPRNSRTPNARLFTLVSSCARRLARTLSRASRSTFRYLNRHHCGRRWI